MPKNDKKPSNKSKQSTFNDPQYEYVISWINEAIDARSKQTALVNRAIAAYQGKPSKNRYSGTIRSYAEQVKKTDVDRAKELMERFKDVPEKGSMVVHDAVETIVSMTMGGVGRYEFGAYDSVLPGDDDLAERLSSAAKHFYANEKIDSLVPRYIRAAVIGGEADLHMKRNNDKTCATIIEASQMLKDPKRFKTNRSRFIGHAQRESFREIKQYVTKSGAGYKLKTLNMAQVYVNEIKMQLNSVTTGGPGNDMLSEAVRKDLDIFYKPTAQMIADKRNDKENGDPNYMYEGDEIELTYLYDLYNNMEFKVVNRRYIIDAREKKFSKSIKYTYQDSQDKEKTGSKTVEFEDPYVNLPVVETFWDKYAITPLFYLLDDFDDLCALESILFHNISIMAPITFVAQSTDGEMVARGSQVAGEIIDGLPQTFGTLSKKHDIEPVILEITRLEEKIKRSLNAIDAFQAQSMVGDRATAKEVVSLSGSVSQGLNSFIANIETAMATLGDKFLKMQVIYNTKDYNFTHNGKYSTLSPQEIAGDYEVRARLASSIKLEQEANSAKAVQLIQALGDNEAVDKQQFLGTMIPIAIGGIVSKEEAKSMVSPQYKPISEEERIRIRKEEERRASMNPIDKIDLTGWSDQQIMDATASIANMGVDPNYSFDQTGPVDASMAQPMLPAADPLANQLNVPDPNTGLPTPANPLSGVSPEQAGTIANDPSINGNGFQL